jgi:hypothetical protein
MSITRDRIDALSPLANLAFAARCVRTAWQGVVPGFWQQPPEALGEALAYAERWAAGEPISECPIVPKVSSPPVAVSLTTAVEWALETGLARDDQMTEAAMRTYERARQAAVRSYSLKAFETSVAESLTQLSAG